MNAQEVALVWFQRLWNEKDVSVIRELSHPEATGYTEGGITRSWDDFESQLFLPLVTAFPDIRVDCEAVTGSESDAVVRWQAVGTHLGELPGVPASGRRIRFEGLTWLSVRDGKIVEGWDRWNLNALLAVMSGGPDSQTARVVAAE